MEVLGRSNIEATGAVILLENSARKFHRVVWKIPIQLVPAILMRDPAYRIDAASSTELISWGSRLILYMGSMLWIPMEFHGAVRRIKISTPIRPA